MEARKNKLLEMIEEEAKTAFYDREMDEDQFKGTVDKYKQEIIEIDVELKKLKKKR